MIKKTFTKVLVLALAGAVISPVTASAENFSCGGVTASSKRSPAYDTIKSLAPTLGHLRALGIVMNQWRGEEMRKACIAKSENRGGDFSCFNDRFDWTEIESRLPDDFTQMNARMAGKVADEFKKHSSGNTAKDAWDFCVDLGVVPKGLKFRNSGG